MKFFTCNLFMISNHQTTNLVFPRESKFSPIIVPRICLNGLAVEKENKLFIGLEKKISVLDQMKSLFAFSTAQIEKNSWK